MNNSNLTIKKRIIYLIIIILSSIIGIGSRHFSESLPKWIAEYAGDTMWALSAYYIIRIIFIKLSILCSACIAFCFSVLIEISQLYHSTWINSIRHTIIGGLILGFGFLWSDIVCYLVGILIGLFIELIIKKSLA